MRDTKWNIFPVLQYIYRGCRQGDPISPYLFILCAEIMAIMVCHDKNIRGIKLGNMSVCLLQYADDTCIFLDGTEKSLKSLMDLLFQFSKYSGLKPNIDKTKAVWIGANLFSNVILCPDIKLEWTNSNFTVLGITYTPDLKNVTSLNYDSYLNKLENELKSWKKRLLTPFGKIIVIKSLLLSKLTHLFSVLPKPDDKFIKTIETKFYNYIWEGKCDKISRKHMIQEYRVGGLNMIHVESFIKSLKLTWLRRLYYNNNYLINGLFEEITSYNIKYFNEFGDKFCLDTAAIVTNSFWTEVLTNLAEFKIKLSKYEKTHSVLNSAIWHNSNIKINKNTVYIKKLYDKGIKQIKDLLSAEKNFLTLEMLQNTNQIKIPFTTYEGLKRAICKSYDLTDKIEQLTSDFEYISRQPKGTKHIYNIFIKSFYTKPKVEYKWENEFNLPDTFDWNTVYNNVLKNTNDTKLNLMA